MATAKPTPPAKARGYAARWGSFLTNGDAGACMYGFDATFTVQDEKHRADCLAWIEGGKPHEPELDALAAAVRQALTEEQRKARDERLDEFTRAYITAALWSSDDMDTEDPLDTNYGIQHVADETFASMIEDCQAFQRDHAATLARCGGDECQAGHDFWLTRNGHGTGFWDRVDAVWDKAARDELSDSARVWGEVDLYVGDDGRIHA